MSDIEQSNAIDLSLKHRFNVAQSVDYEATKNGLTVRMELDDSSGIPERLRTVPGVSELNISCAFLQHSGIGPLVTNRDIFHENGRSESMDYLTEAAKARRNCNPSTGM